MNGELVETYRLASANFCALVADVPDDLWEAPGLGSWTVRELVGHTNRAYTTIEDYLLHPQDPEPPGSSYFSDGAIAQRGRQAVLALGDDPAVSVAATAERVLGLIEASSPESALGSPIGTMTLADYLPSRIAELVIHGMDLAQAISVERPIPESCMRQTLAFVAQRAAKKDSQLVLRALIGRGQLPAGYSVY
ncbi:MAG: maleylpyruvate isomerase family mycothiol-dependent enzyme [Actinomycetota bacterium]|nr:maleylpyruvate isomerase family mycothiol-dependent enzyme [Actinomycetota bacterium]